MAQIVVLAGMPPAPIIPGFQKVDRSSERKPRASSFALTEVNPERPPTAEDGSTAQTAAAKAHNNSSNVRDGLGTTYHEAGTLWMGTDHNTSVTDPNGRFHHTANAFCADQSLFVTVGSVNPTLTGLVLARKVAEAVMDRATGEDASPTPTRRKPLASGVK